MLKNKLISSLVLIVFGVLIAVWPGASAEVFLPLDFVNEKPVIRWQNEWRWEND